MRDSALKRSPPTSSRGGRFGRRRAHARQRFETIAWIVLWWLGLSVGEELMRDSALKPLQSGIHAPWRVAETVGEELMRDSALKPATSLSKAKFWAQSEKSSCATAL